MGRAMVTPMSCALARLHVYTVYGSADGNDHGMGPTMQVYTFHGTDHGTAHKTLRMSWDNTGSAPWTVP